MAATTGRTPLNRRLLRRFVSFTARPLESSRFDLRRRRHFGDGALESRSQGTALDGLTAERLARTWPRPWFRLVARDDIAGRARAFGLGVHLVRY